MSVVLVSMVAVVPIAPAGAQETPDATSQVAHVPVATGFAGQAVPMEAEIRCPVGGPCGARVYYQETTLPEGEVPVDAGAALAARSWSTQELTRGDAVAADEGFEVVNFSGEVPGVAVTTAGLDYWVEAEAGATTSTSPPPADLGWQRPFHHVHVVNPPLIVHTPPPFGRSGEPLAVEAQVTCAQPCSATLVYRISEGSAADVELLEMPDWPQVAMDEPSTPVALGDAGTIHTFRAEVPADSVDTRGVDYFVLVDDGTTTSYWPGTSAQGVYVPTAGFRTGYQHVHVLEPPRIVHVPPATAAYRDAIEVRVTTNCASLATCSATLFYRTTIPSGDFTQVAMTLVPAVATSGIDVLEAVATIPPEVVDTRGVDYYIRVSDGPTTAYWPGTSHVDGYVTADGTRVEYQHVHVLEPPHFIHAPVVAVEHGQDLVITTDLNCATEACQVSLTYTLDPAAGPDSYTTVAMTLVEIVSQSPAGRIERWQATVPGQDVTVRGAAYLMEASDGYTSTATPGTSYWGTYVIVEGGTVDGADAGPDGEGAHAFVNSQARLMHQVRVLEPIHLLHAPPPNATPGEPVTIEASANCATGACTAELSYRLPGGPWQTLDMTSEAVAAASAQEMLHFAATIPGVHVSTEGLEYFLTATDGFTDERTAILPLVVANAAVQRRIDATADRSDPADGTDQVRVAAAGTPPSPAEVTSIGLLDFDVSTVPPDHTILAATLHLTPIDGDIDLAAQLRPVTAAWTETDGTAPPLGDDSIPVTLVPGVTSVIDVTDWLAGWVAAPETAHGVALLPSTTLAHETLLASREHADPALRPHLQVTHVAQDQINGPQPTIDQPTAGQQLFHTEPVTGTVDTGSHEASRVELLVDEQLAGSTDAANFAFDLDTTSLTDGEHTLRVRAVDSNGAATSTVVNVMVDNSMPAQARLDHDLALGRLTAGDYTIHRINGLINHDLLPARYASGDPIEVTDLTGQLHQAIGQLWADLTPAERQAIDALFSPQTTAAGSSFAQATGDCAAADTALFGVDFTCTHHTPNFTIYYTLDTTDPVHGLTPGVGPAATPSHVDDVAASLEDAHAFYTGGGFVDPAADAPVPIFLFDVARSSVDFLPSGFSSPFGTRPILMDKDGTEHYLPRHELFHIFQYEYLIDTSALNIASYLLLGGNYGWWMEATAEWAAHQSYPDIAAMEAAGQTVPPSLRAQEVRYARSLSLLAGDPARSLTTFEPAGSRQYGSFVLAEYLQERFGDHVVLETFEQIDADNEPGGPNTHAIDSIDQVIQAHDPARTIAEEIPDFWESLYFLRSQADQHPNVADGPISDDHRWEDPHADTIWRADLDADGALSDSRGDDYARPDRTVIDLADLGTRTASVRSGGAQFIDLTNTATDGRVTDVRVTIAIQPSQGNPELHASLVATSDYRTECINNRDERTFTGTRTLHVTLGGPAGADCDTATLIVVNPHPGGITSQEVLFDISVIRIVQGAALTNGTLQLGVSPDGRLGIPGGAPVPNSAPSPRSDIRPTGIGLRLLQPDSTGTPAPTREVIASGCWSEGWGIGDVDSQRGAATNDCYTTGIFGSRNSGQHYGITSSFSGITEQQMTITSTVTPDATLAEETLQVSHHFHPSISDYAYAIDVEVTNTGSQPHTLQYRRVADLDASEGNRNMLTIQPLAAVPELVQSTNQGIASPNPFTRADYQGHTGFFTDSTDPVYAGHQGPLLQFDLGTLDPGETTTFTLFYGAAPSQDDALAVLADIGATVYGLAEPLPEHQTGAAGTPHSFFLAYKP